MKFNRTVRWLDEWQNEFQTCYELWQELEANATAGPSTTPLRNDAFNFITAI